MFGYQLVGNPKTGFSASRLIYCRHKAAGNATELIKEFNHVTEIKICILCMAVYNCLALERVRRTFLIMRQLIE